MEIIKREKGEFGEIKIDFYLNKDRLLFLDSETNREKTRAYLGYYSEIPH